MSQSHGSNSQGIHTSVAGKLLLFHQFQTQKVRKKSRTENGQVKNISRLESMLPSMALLLLQKKIGLKSRPVIESTVRGFCAMYKGELEKARKEKCPIAPNLNVLLREPPFLLGS